MRVFRLLATASVFALPRAASAGLWSYFESDEAAAEDEKSGGSVPVTEQETPEPPTGADDDPLIAGFPGLVAWFRSHGGVREYFLIHVVVCPMSMHSTRMHRTYLVLS